MSPVPKLFALFALALSVNALATPHAGHNAFAHRAVAQHQPLAAVESLMNATTVEHKKKKRSLSKRCKPKSGSSSASSAPSSAPVPSSSSSSIASASSSAPQNVAPSPVLPSASSAAASAPTSSASFAAAPAPTSSSSAAPAPAPSSSSSSSPPAWTPTSTSSAAPAQTSPSSGSIGSLPSFLTGTQTGQGTYYTPGLGACGITNSATDFIVAVSHLLFDTFPGYNGVNPNDNPVCNKQVTANYQGKSVTVTITDRCTGCAITDLDFSPSAFNTLANPSVGRISGMDWDWIGLDLSAL